MRNERNSHAEDTGIESYTNHNLESYPCYPALSSVTFVSDMGERLVGCAYGPAIAEPSTKKREVSIIQEVDTIIVPLLRQLPDAPEA